MRVQAFIATVAALLVGLTASAQQQDEIYLEITQPGLRRVSVAAPPLMVLPGTPAEVAHGFQETLDADLAAAAPIAILERRLRELEQLHIEGLFETVILLARVVDIVGDSRLHE